MIHPLSIAFVTNIDEMVYNMTTPVPFTIFTPLHKKRLHTRAHARHKPLVSHCNKPSKLKQQLHRVTRS